MLKNKNISQVNFASSIILIVILITLSGSLLIFEKHSRFKSESEKLREEYIKSRKESVRTEVEKVIDYIEFNRSQRENRLKENIKSRVYEAHCIAENLYEKNKGTKSLAEIKNIVREALRPVRFNEGQGYYFAVSMDGVEQLYPVRPEFEGENLLDLQDAKGNYVIQDEIETIKESPENEEFVIDYWAKPGEDPSIHYKKISFIKLLQPLDWYIGTGEYLEDVEKEIQKEVLNRIQEIRFGNEGYIFIHTFDGICLSHVNEERIGENRWDLVNEEGRKIVQELIETSRQESGGYLEYVATIKPSSEVPALKYSYLKSFDEWEWAIGAGFYIEDLKAVIAEKNADLKRDVARQIFFIFIFLIFSFIGTFGLAKFFNKKIKDEAAVFTKFFDKAITTHEKIDSEKLSFAEFKALSASANHMIDDYLKNKKILEDSIESYQNIFQNAQVGLFRTRITDGKFLEANQQMAKMFGYDDLDEFLAEYASSPNYVDPKAREKMFELLEENGEFRNYEARLYRKDGTIAWFRYSGKIYPEKGWTEGVAEDITERKAAEEALSREKEHLLVTLRSIGDGVISTDREGKIFLINKAAETLTGWHQEEVIGKNLSEVFDIKYEKSREKWESPIKKVLEEDSIVEFEEEIILTSRYEEERLIANSAAPIHNKENQIIGVVLVFRDVTQERKIQRELQKMQKLESVGVLAGGIAHDFNNALSGILANLTLARIYLKSGDEISEILSDAEKACLKAKSLTNQLLVFAKGGAPVKKLTSIANILQETVTFATRGTRIQTEFSIPKNLWAVEIDPDQISQVINNLTINAVQAMPKGGTFRITAENFYLNEKKEVGLENNNYIKIFFQDEGCGIPEKEIHKIFDPFYTTKETGSGLGLFASISIIQNHGGLIYPESKVGKGTIFYVYLPANKNVKIKKEETEEKEMQGNGKILIMDDEKIILRATCKLLERMGYETKAVEDGEAAIEAYKKAMEAGTPFDVVIMDLTIPGGMGGIEALKILKEIDPNVQAVVTSGYSNDPIMANYEDYGFQGVAVKPYKIQQLNEVLTEIIEKISR